MSLPTTQKAVLIKETGPQWAVEISTSHPVPQLEPNQALIHLTHTGVCHSDISAISGIWGSGMTATCKVPGHEGIGRIVAYHEKQDTPDLPPLNAKVGVPLLRLPCKECAACKSGEEVYCPNSPFHGVMYDGTYQQYIAVPSAYLTLVPEAVPDAQAAPIMCGGVTSYKALKRSGAKKGDTVVIAGAGGGLGNFAVQYALAMGFKVIGIDTGDDKKAATMALGAVGFVDYKQVDSVPMEVLKLTGGAGADAAIVIAPSDQSYNTAWQYVGLHGTIVCVGLPHEEVLLRIPPGLLVLKDVKVVGSLVGTRQDIAEALEFAAKGQVKPDVVVQKMETIESVYKAMEKGEVKGRIVLELK